VVNIQIFDGLCQMHKNAKLADKAGEY